MRMVKAAADRGELRGCLAGEAESEPAEGRSNLGDTDT